MADDKSEKPSATPPQGPWAAMAREIAGNPDSPASLRIMSAINAALRPRQASVDQVVQAFIEQMERPGFAADAAVAAAVKHWESACGTPATINLLEQFRQEAVDLVERRRRRPPPLESIVSGVGDRLDMGYELGADLAGLRGTWHRLWASISMGRMFGDTPEQRECVTDVRAQFEELLGRAMTADEWDQLERHAHNHGDTIAKQANDAGGSPTA